MSPPRSVPFVLSIALLTVSCGSAETNTTRNSSLPAAPSAPKATSRLNVDFEYLEATSLEKLISYSDVVVVATAQEPQPSRTTDFGLGPLIVTDQDFVIESVVASTGNERVGDIVRLQITGGVDDKGVLWIADRERLAVPKDKYLLFLRRFKPDDESSKADAEVTHIAVTAGQSMVKIGDDGTLSPLLDPKDFPTLTLPELSGTKIDAVAEVISADAPLLRVAPG